MSFIICHFGTSCSVLSQCFGASWLFRYQLTLFWHKMLLLRLTYFIVNMPSHLGVVLESLPTMQTAISMGVFVHYQMCLEIAFIITAIHAAFFWTGIVFTIMHLDMSHQTWLVLKRFAAVLCETAMSSIGKMFNSVILQLAFKGKSFSTSFISKFEIRVAVFKSV